MEQENKKSAPVQEKEKEIVTKSAVREKYVQEEKYVF